MDVEFFHDQFSESFNITLFLHNFLDQNEENISSVFNNSCKEDESLVAMSEIVTNKVIPVLVVVGILGIEKVYQFLFLKPLIRQCDSNCEYLQ